MTSATTLATVLGNDGADIDRICNTLDTMFAEYTDEKKADLYSLLAESLRPGQTFRDRQAACEIAIRLNDGRFPRG